MSLDKDAAREALNDLERTQQRARAFSGYRHSGPIFAAWGVFWLGGNLAQYYGLAQADLIFGCLGAAAIAVSVVCGMSAHRPSASPALRRKSLLSALLVAVFVLGLMTILGPAGKLLANAAISFLFAGIYTFAGIWLGKQIAWLGVVLMAVILAGWIGAREHFELIMGLGGGGVLMLTGLWFWRQ